VFAIASSSAITISLQDLSLDHAAFGQITNQSATNPEPDRGQCAGMFFATSDILHPNLCQCCINVALVIAVAR
jgi:hypothetical protein